MPNNRSDACGLAVQVRADLTGTLPLALIPEDGTWAAGRKLAQRLSDGRHPLSAESGETVL